MTRRVFVKIRQVGPELRMLVPDTTVLLQQHADPTISQLAWKAAISQALKEFGATL